MRYLQVGDDRVKNQFFAAKYDSGWSGGIASLILSSPLRMSRKGGLRLMSACQHSSVNLTGPDWASMSFSQSG